MEKIKIIVIKKIIYIAFLLLSFLSFSQQKNIGQLKNDIKNAKNQESKIDAINAMGLHWYESNFDSATYYFEKAFKTSKKVNYKPFL